MAEAGPMGGIEFYKRNLQTMCVAQPWGRRTQEAVESW